MFRRHLAFVLICAAAALAQAPQPQTATAPGEQRYEVIIQKSVMIPMRDGVKLATDIYFPARDGKPVDGKFPVIMERTPYGKATARFWANYFVPRGYIAVAQDTRGRFESEGVWRGLVDDPNDGYDTAQWLGRQPWFSGAIGTVGTSYPGGTQNALALANAPFLKAMIPSCAVSDQGEYGMRHAGAWEMRFFNWIFNIAGPNGSPETMRDPHTKEAVAEAGEHVREYAQQLPLRKGDTPLKLIPEYEDWLIQAMSHGGNDSFWRNSGTDVIDNIAKFEDVPVLHITGWYDSWTHQVADMDFSALARARSGC